MVISGQGLRLIFSQPSVVSLFVRLLVEYFIKTQRNTQMYAFALRNTTVNHIRGCVVKILYPTLPRFQSKMAIVWDRSIPECRENEGDDFRRHRSGDSRLEGYRGSNCSVSRQVTHRAVVSQANLFHREVNVYAEVVACRPTYQRHVTLRHLI